MDTRKSTTTEEPTEKAKVQSEETLNEVVTEVTSTELTNQTSEPQPKKVEDKETPNEEMTSSLSLTQGISLPELGGKAKGLNDAFIDLILFAEKHQLAGLVDCSNLKLKEELATSLFPAMASEAVSDFLSGKKMSQGTRESKLSEIGGHITTVIGASDSCGAVGNYISEIFLGEDANKLKYAGAEKTNFKELTAETGKLFFDDAAPQMPCLVRVEVSRENESSREIQSHSYCILVTPSPKDGTPIAYIYQAYYGGYNLAQWFNDEKFRNTQHGCDFRGYCEVLATLCFPVQEIRTTTYGELYRLTGTEGEVPDKPTLHVRWRAEPVDIELAMKNVLAKKEELSGIVKELQGKSPEQYLTDKCWESLSNAFPGREKEIASLRGEVEEFKRSLEGTGYRF